jgi:hypothetical protein
MDSRRKAQYKINFPLYLGSAAFYVGSARVVVAFSRRIFRRGRDL